jgi:hypothetical protein
MHDSHQSEQEPVEYGPGSSNHFSIAYFGAYSVLISRQEGDEVHLLLGIERGL